MQHTILLSGSTVSHIYKVDVRRAELKLKTNLYSTIHSADSGALDDCTRQLSSHRGYDEIKMFEMVSKSS